MIKNYHKFVDRSYRSGGSGSHGGGKSMENIQHVKNQYYPKPKLNMSDINDPQVMQSIHEDTYSSKARRTGKNSRDMQFMKPGILLHSHSSLESRKMSELTLESQKQNSHGRPNYPRNPNTQSHSYRFENDVTANRPEMVDLVEVSNKPLFIGNGRTK